MSKWSDARKFWSETIRTMAFAILGTIGLYCVVSRLNNQRAYEAELDKEKLSIRSSAIDQFLNESHKFTAIASDALRTGSPESIDGYENRKRDPYTQSLMKIRLFFANDSEINGMIDKINLLDRQLHNFMKVETRKKEDWEPVRQQLKAAHHKLAERVLSGLGVTGN